jgi:hypothetical protein
LVFVPKVSHNFYFQEQLYFEKLVAISTRVVDLIYAVWVLSIYSLVLGEVTTHPDLCKVAPIKWVITLVGLDNDSRKILYDLKVWRGFVFKVITFLDLVNYFWVGKEPGHQNDQQTVRNSIFNFLVLGVP